jgi:hypothetical protein
MRSIKRTSAAISPLTRSVHDKGCYGLRVKHRPTTPQNQRATPEHPISASPRCDCPSTRGFLCLGEKMFGYRSHYTVLSTLHALAPRGHKLNQLTQTRNPDN